MTTIDEIIKMSLWGIDINIFYVISNKYIVLLTKFFQMLYMNEILLQIFIKIRHMDDIF